MEDKAARNARLAAYTASQAVETAWEVVWEAELVASRATRAWEAVAEIDERSASARAAWITEREAARATRAARAAHAIWGWKEIMKKEEYERAYVAAYAYEAFLTAADAYAAAHKECRITTLTGNSYLRPRAEDYLICAHAEYKKAKTFYTLALARAYRNQERTQPQGS